MEIVFHTHPLHMIWEEGVGERVFLIYLQTLSVKDLEVDVSRRSETEDLELDVGGRRERDRLFFNWFPHTSHQCVFLKWLWVGGMRVGEGVF